MLPSQGLLPDVQDLNRTYDLVQRNETAQAIDALATYIIKHPETAIACRRLTIAAKDAGRLNDIEQFFQALANRDPRNGIVSYALGLVAAERGDRDRSRQLYWSAVENSPRCSLCYEALIGTYPNSELESVAVWLRRESLRDPTNGSLDYALVLLSGRDRSRTQSGMRALESGLKKTEASGDLETHARLLSETSRIYVDWDPQRCIRAAEQAEREFDRIGEAEGVELARGIVQRNYMIYRQFDRALVYAQAHLARAQATGNPAPEAMAYMDLGELLRDSGNLRAAIGAFEESALIRRQAHRPAAEIMQALAGVAGVHLLAGEHQQAIAQSEEILREAEQVNDLWWVGLASRGLGNVYAEIGDLGRALEYQTRSVEAFRKRNLHWQAGAGVGSIGEIYVMLGDYEKAEACFREALKSGLRFHDASEQERHLTNLAEIRISQGRYAAAAQYLQRAANLSKTVAHRPFAAAIHIDLCELYRRTGQSGPAQESCAAGLRLAGELKIASLEASARIASGDLNLSTQRYASAEADFNRALAIADPSNLEDIRWRAHVGLGDLAKRQARPRDALKHYSAAIDAIETVRQDLTEGAQKVSFLQDKFSAYARAIETAAELHNEELALDLSERGRARAFLDTLATSESKGSTDANEAATTNQILPMLDRARIVLLEYSLGEHASWAWLVGHGRVRMARLPPRATIEALVRAYREHIARPPENDDATQVSLSRKLYATLVGPLEHDLPSGERLLIVPDGMLHYLPFDALTKAGAEVRYVAEDFEITYVPSASVWMRLANRNRHNRPMELLAYGDPEFQRAEDTEAVSPANLVRGSLGRRGLRFAPLPSTREEVESIASFYADAERKTYLGAQATEESVKRERLSDYRYIHFATHAIVDERVPARSGVVLATTEPGKEDGILDLNEILRLKLDADLVVLSACQTGLGRVVRGEGMIGLARAFLHAGSSAVSVSLWSVNDMSTAVLMKAFYGGLRSSPPSEALRQAKLQMLKSDVQAYRHPYYWAPFVIVGRE